MLDELVGAVQAIEILRAPGIYFFRSSHGDLLQANYNESVRKDGIGSCVWRYNPHLGDRLRGSVFAGDTEIMMLPRFYIPLSTLERQE